MPTVRGPRARWSPFRRPHRYVFARDGQLLPPRRPSRPTRRPTTSRMPPPSCATAASGPQRKILREGTYPSTCRCSGAREERVYAWRSTSRKRTVQAHGRSSRSATASRRSCSKARTDVLGIVTVHDGRRCPWPDHRAQWVRTRRMPPPTTTVSRTPSASSPPAHARRQLQVLVEGTSTSTACSRR